MTSTLDGWQPAPGDIVWQQMWSPVTPRHDSTIEERIAHGVKYKRRRRMEVVAVVRDYELGLDRWILRPADPKDRRGEFHHSIVESDWCVLEPEDPADEGRLW